MGIPGLVVHNLFVFAGVLNQRYVVQNVQVKPFFGTLRIGASGQSTESTPFLRIRSSDTPGVTMRHDRKQSPATQGEAVQRERISFIHASGPPRHLFERTICYPKISRTTTTMAITR